MIIQTEKLQEQCSKILGAVDSSVSTDITETLELEVKGSTLFLNVTNKEYYVSVNIPLTSEETTTFHAVVNASLFLNLVSKITTKEIELSTTDTTLVVKGNGTYKLPLVFTGDSLVVLPTIEIENVTSEFAIKSEALKSIVKYNLKELSKGDENVRKRTRLFYVDEHGCITRTTGACVNNFELPQAVKLYLTEKIVKLFKLFKEETVNFSLGYDSIANGTILTKVRFKTPTVELTAILTNDEKLISTIPVNAIRGRADAAYAYKVSVDKGLLLDAISRLSLFHQKDAIKVVSHLVFSDKTITVYDTKKDNFEVIPLVNEVPELVENYTAIFNTDDFKTTLESCEEQYITISFGNHQAVVVERNNVKNVVPECN